MSSFKNFVEQKSGLDDLVQMLRRQYPGLDLHVWENDSKIELSNITVPEELRGRGIGSNIVNTLKDYAKQVGKPVVVRPSPEKGKIAALNRFYTRHKFVKNKGRNLDFSLSSPFAATRYWKP